MRKASALEKGLQLEFKKLGIVTLQDKALQPFLKKVQQLLTQKKFEEAAEHFSALVSVLSHDKETAALQAAQLYHKAGDTEKAANFYFQAAELYAKVHTSKAIASLRRYMQLKPDDITAPRYIYDMCGEEYFATESLMHGLSDEDRAGHRLVAHHLFKSFDKSNFNKLLQSLSYHKLHNGDVLTQMGDEAKSMFVVISGKLSGYLNLKGKRTYLGDLQENDICGETAYFTGGRRTTEIIAKGETEVFEIPYHTLDQFKSDFSDFRQAIESNYKSRILVKQLALTTVFANVNPQVRDDIANKMTPVSFRAGETLFREGELGIGLYIVRRGKLAVTIDVKGCETLVKTVETGGVVGEISMLTNGKRTATVRAVSDTVLMHLDEQNYHIYFEKCPALQQTVQQLKQAQVKETLNLMKNSKAIDGDDTCTILLKNIWQDH